MRDTNNISIIGKHEKYQTVDYGRRDIVDVIVTG